jgi:hypothetical protein
MQPILPFLGAGLVALGCATPATQSPTLNAVLLETCAPSDGPAVTLFLTEQAAVDSYPSPPYLAISVYRPLRQILGRRFDLSPDAPGPGSGQACGAGGTCAPAPGATIAFGGMNADSTIGVTYRLDAADGRVLSGAVRARLSPVPRRCL